MGDSMPRPKELSKCDHPWDSVEIVVRKTVVGSMEKVIDTSDVYFCNDCETVIEEV